MYDYLEDNLSSQIKPNPISLYQRLGTLTNNIIINGQGNIGKKKPKGYQEFYLSRACKIDQFGSTPS